MVLKIIPSILGLELALEIQDISGPKLADFKRVVNTNEVIIGKIKDLRNEIEAFAKSFPLPGLEEY